MNGTSSYTCKQTYTHTYINRSFQVPLKFIFLQKSPYRIFGPNSLVFFPKVKSLFKITFSEPFRLTWFLPPSRNYSNLASYIHWMVIKHFRMCFLCFITWFASFLIFLCCNEFCIRHSFSPFFFQPFREDALYSSNCGHGDIRRRKLDIREGFSVRGQRVFPLPTHFTWPH